MNIKSIFKCSKTNWRYVAIVAVLAFVAGAGILGYQYYWLPRQEAEALKQTLENETADWNVYRNEEYGFEFKYPVNMTGAIHAEQMLLDEDQWVDIGVGLKAWDKEEGLISLLTSQDTRMIEHLHFKGLLIDVLVQPNEDNDTVQSYIERYKLRFDDPGREGYIDPSQCKETPIILGGHSAIRLDKCSWLGTKYILLRPPEHKWILIVHYTIGALDGENIGAYRNTIDQILSTFRFKGEAGLPEKFNCVSSDLPGYKLANEFFVDFNSDKQDELVRVYAQLAEGNCGAELPMVVKIFSGATACRKEEFAYPAILAPIAGGFDDDRYNSANARLMKNFWGDGRDVILVTGALNFCGSGVRSQLLFFSYQDAKYLKVDGPIFGELDFYFLSSRPKGSAILVVQAKWEEGESHFGPHRYGFVLYQWNGQEYDEVEIGTTNNKYVIGDEDFETILQNIEDIFQNEPGKLQLEIESL